ncbi:P-loop containing nucleoside triphosphate hydrolase protein [Chytriomyces sp. MP71]|nr:P-loop containing nucleoside triphosphate hydrolase protein [Chytriomyces sp. MP71]
MLPLHRLLSRAPTWLASSQCRYWQNSWQHSLLVIPFTAAQPLWAPSATTLSARTFSSKSSRGKKNREQLSRKERSQNKLASQKQENPTEPKRPIPPSSTYFPNNFQNHRENFLSYYLARFALQPPKVHSEHPSNLERHLRPRIPEKQWKWTVKHHLPAHTITLSNGETRSLPDMSVTVSAASQRDAIKRSTELLLAHLLADTHESIIAECIEFYVPVKRRIADMTDKDAGVCVSEDVAGKAETLMSELREAHAFKVLDRVAFAGGDVLKEEEKEKEAKASAHRKRMLQKAGVQGSPYGALTQQRRLRDKETLETPHELDRSKHLPMHAKYPEIMAAIEAHNVVVLAASTGAGKTTQLPQFILAHYNAEREALRRMAKSASFAPLPPNVIVTQPRRIAAISVAHRVAQERGEVLGRNSAIGYSVRFQNMQPKETRDGQVLFCTSGILLRMLQDKPNLEGVTHILLDEVHERDLNTDLLLIIVRALVARRPDLKVILMSATADTSLFASYFSKSPHLIDPRNSFSVPSRTRSLATPLRSRETPIISVPGRLYPVREFHLDDALPLALRLRPESRMHALTRRYIRDEMAFQPRPGGDAGAFLRGREDTYFPVDLCEALLAHIVLNRPAGAVLVFLPGWVEIKALMERLQEDAFGVGFRDPKRARLFVLHSSVAAGSQEEVFKKVPEGVRKVILATNVAETSVTIDDVVYVVDTAKVRINTYDAAARVSALRCVVASQSNLKQRAGRAGRVQPGEYYSLISKRRREALPYSIPPELLRVDLQSTALKVKSLDIAPTAAEVLALAPQPPPVDAVSKALDELKCMGAIEVVPRYPLISNKAWAKKETDEILTPLGQALAQMPVDPWLGKLVILAAAFGALEPVLVAAAILGGDGGRGIYAIHPDVREQARMHLLKMFYVGRKEAFGSDLLAMVCAFRDWKEVKGGDRARREFAEANFLSHAALINVDRGREQLLGVLKDVGISALVKEGILFNANSANAQMVRSLISGALFPNVAEIKDKNVYGTPFEQILKITGSTMNSYSSYQLAKNYEINPATPLSVANSSTNTTIANASTSDEDDDLEDKDVATFQPPVVPPRFLSYHEKQMLDGVVWLRTTTVASPLGLLLFGSLGGGRVQWIQDAEGRWIALVGGWLRVSFADERSKKVVQEIKEWMERYVEWVVAGGMGRTETEQMHVLAARLVALVSRMVEEAEEE